MRRPCDYLAYLRFLTLPPPIYEVQRVHFIYFLVSVLLFSPVWYGAIEVCRVEVYSVLFAVCARFILFVVGGSACFLIMRDRANDSLFCLLVVHIEVIRRGFICSCVLLFHIERFYFSCVVGTIEVCRVEVYSA